MIIWVNTNCNDVRGNSQDLFLLSVPYKTTNTVLKGFNLIPNTRMGFSLFLSKSLVKSNWINTNNVYLAHKDSL